MQEGESDPGLYDYRHYSNRKKTVWPEGKTCAVRVAPNLEYYEIDPPINPHRKPWPKPHPDVVGFSYRDHSNRVSHWRMAEVMSKYGFPGSARLSVALCRHHPAVVQDGVERGWVNDELPYRFANGLIALPPSVDLPYRQIVAAQQHSAKAWAQMMRDAFDWLASEAEAQNSARALPVQLTPYIMGQPFCIAALEQLLVDLARCDQAWFATGADIVNFWREQQ